MLFVAEIICNLYRRYSFYLGGFRKRLELNLEKWLRVIRQSKGGKGISSRRRRNKSHALCLLYVFLQGCAGLAGPEG